jgi:N-acetylglutamate synthase-like GNAT family acetyltransferase
VSALRFRFATKSDVPEVIALIERAYRGPEANLGWTTETHLLEGPRTRAGEVAELVTDPESRFVLAEIDEMLAGCALIQRNDEKAYFGMFAVDPRRQAAGAGRALLAACEDSARLLWSARAMTMSVISLRADLIEWYERRGYHRTGTSEPFPFHEQSGELRRDFDLVHLTKQL